MKDQFDNIIRYLNNEMTTEERLTFEQLLKEDTALAEEVEFQRGLQGFLDREAPLLENKLDRLGNEFFEKKSNPNWRKLFGLLLIFSLISSIVYLAFFQQKEIPSSTPAPMTEEVDSTNIPVQEFEKEEVIEKNVKEPSVKTPPPAVAKTIPPKVNQQPIAALNPADFKRNDILENLIASTSRDDASQEIVNITQPPFDAIFNGKKIVALLVKGTTNISPPYRLTVYSNRDFDIENDFRVLDASLNSYKNEDKYAFRFNGEIPLKKGLYYLIIRKDGRSKVMHISRFTVE